MKKITTKLLVLLLGCTAFAAAHGVLPGAANTRWLNSSNVGKGIIVAGLAAAAYWYYRCCVVDPEGPVQRFHFETDYQAVKAIIDRDQATQQYIFSCYSPDGLRRYVHTLFSTGVYERERAEAYNFVYRDSEGTKGFVSGYRLDQPNSRIGRINILGVDERFRRQGVAQQLMRTIIKHFRSQGAEIITIDVVNTNEPAKKLYKKLGFEESGKLVFPDPSIPWVQKMTLVQQQAPV